MIAEPHGFFLAVAGNIGVGKTHVSRSLSERLGWPVYFEPVIENPYLDAFYGDMARWAFHLQIYFLSERYQAQRRFAAEQRSFIQDRTIYEDAEIFARTLLAQGDMTRTDYDTYRSLFASMVETLRPPDLVVYLRAPVDALLARIRSRGRSCERMIARDYLERLEEAYATWMAEARDRFDVLEVDTEPASFLTAGMAEVEAAVQARLATRTSDVEPR